MRKIALLLALLATTAGAGELGEASSKDGGKTWYTTPTLSGSSGISSTSITTWTGPRYLSISCGVGSVSISMKDGKVTLKDCTADEGAKAFWDAIERMYPGAIPH